MDEACSIMPTKMFMCMSVYSAAQEKLLVSKYHHAPIDSYRVYVIGKAIMRKSITSCNSRTLRNTADPLQEIISIEQHPHTHYHTVIHGNITCILSLNVACPDMKLDVKLLSFNGKPQRKKKRIMLVVYLLY